MFSSLTFSFIHDSLMFSFIHESLMFVVYDAKKTPSTFLDDQEQINR
jgi:hypothetical protein